ncbi:MAG: protein kinase domain-containing protein [Phycisphaerales bacterium]
MDDQKPKPKPKPVDPLETMATMADEVVHTAADDVTIPDYVEYEHDVPTLPPGTVVGKYTIDKVLGVGGMGAVYRATQDKPHRQVALKLIRAGVLSSKSIRRFDLEAEILGRLHHPNIAQIHEAGIDQDSGSPYFAMEYVAGEELGDYVKEKNLSTRKRLELFVKLCDAIQHAHAKGVIHRDLKPANVLVDQAGEPKVLDFGVARATDSESAGNTMQTNVGQLIGTLYYMSPEQAIGDTTNLDTRSDVYALGVVLYEILTGHIPYDLKDKAIHEAVRIIADSKHTKLSTYDGSLTGDIEVIVGKALDKDKDRRYQSAAELSKDIRRSLDNQPISARPPSMVYKTTKFVRRNTGLTIAAACILIIFTVATGFAATQWVRRIEARQLALENMLTTLTEMDVQNGTGPALAGRLLDLYSEHGKALFASDQDSLAVFYTNIGEAFLGYEDYEKALLNYNKTLEIRESLHSAPHPLIANAYHNIARALFFLKRYDEAKTQYETALNMRDSLFDLDDPGAADLATTLNHLGSTHLRLGEYDTAIDYYQRAKYIRTKLFGAGSLEVARTNNSIAAFYTETRQFDLAVQTYREQLELLRSLPEDDSKPLWEARTHNNLGRILINLGQYDKAVDEYNKSLVLKQVLLGNDKASVAETHQSLAGAYYHLGEYENALTHALESVRIRELLDEDPRFLQSAQADLTVIQSKVNENATTADTD